MNPAGNVMQRARRAAANLMTDSCSIARKPSTTGAFNQTTGQYGTTGATIAYVGACSITPSAQLELEAGEAQSELDLYQVDLPYTAAVLRDMLVTVTASADATLVGKVLLVRTVNSATRTIYRRALCEVLP